MIKIKLTSFFLSVFISVFLGNPPQNVSEWKISPNLIGSSAVFANSTPQHCANCRKRGDVVVDGIVYLNQSLLASDGVQSYEPEVVAPFLEKNLHWRVLRVRLLLSLRF